MTKLLDRLLAAVRAWTDGPTHLTPDHGWLLPVPVKPRRSAVAVKP